MNIAVKYLSKRNRIFYFRYRLPKRFSPLSQKEIRISLRTKDLKRAVILANFMKIKIREYIDTGMVDMASYDEIREIIGGYITQGIEDNERLIAEFGKMCRKTQLEQINGAISNLIGHKQFILENNIELRAKQAKWWLDQSKIEYSDHDIPFMAAEILKADFYLKYIHLERIAGKRIFSKYNEEDYENVL